MSSPSDSLIIFLCILGACVIVLICWAVTHHYFGDSGGVDDEQRRMEVGGGGMAETQNQAVYMQEVRSRNMERIVDAQYGDRGGAYGRE